MAKYDNLAILFFKIFLKIITRFLYFEISILVWQVFVKNRDDFLAIKRYLKNSYLNVLLEFFRGTSTYKYLYIQKYKYKIERFSVPYAPESLEKYESSHNNHLFIAYSKDNLKQ